MMDEVTLHTIQFPDKNPNSYSIGSNQLLSPVTVSCSLARKELAAQAIELVPSDFSLKL